MAAKNKNNTFADEFGVNYRFVSWFTRVFSKIVLHVVRPLERCSSG